MFGEGRMQLQVHEPEQAPDDDAHGLPSSVRGPQDGSNDAAGASAEGSSAQSSSGVQDHAAGINPSRANETALKIDSNDSLKQVTDDVGGETGPSVQPAPVQISGDANQPEICTGLFSTRRLSLLVLNKPPASPPPHSAPPRTSGAFKC